MRSIVPKLGVRTLREVTQATVPAALIARSSPAITQVVDAPNGREHDDWVVHYLVTFSLISGPPFGYMDLYIT